MSTESRKSQRTAGNNIDAGRLINDASGIVLKAASILEQNIAEGIIAAQKVEKKYVDTEKVRGNKDDIMNKFRKDTHEALDIFFDALTLATQSLQELTQKVQTMQKEPSGEASTPNIPVLSLEEALSPGSDATIPLTLENESETDEMKLQFFDQGLSKDADNLIHSRNITYEPKVFSLKPGEKGVVHIRVHIPQSAEPGIYTGLVKERNLAGLEAMLRLEVKE